ncbi:MAG: hypothetical protein NW204_09460 [Xanthomonadaceae bacterium]|nr:hypothetical protein [Xanthomonadaceae bacterium]
MPFPAPYPTLLGSDIKMEQALEAALWDTHTSFPLFGDIPHVALSIAAVEGPDDFRHAGIDFGRTYYSASVLKVVIPYCAYQLRIAVEDVGNAAGATDGATAYAAARLVIDPLAASAVPAIAAAGIPVAMQVPKYEQIFAIIPTVGGGISVNINAGFETLMRRALIESSNEAAAICIKHLGYGWINGALAAGGFFLPPTQGIWLCGTFDGSRPSVPVESVNDGQVAQATTTFDMANLYANVLRGSLVDSSASSDIDQLLRNTASGPEPSWMDGTRRDTGSSDFTVTHTKIGVGPLKTGKSVFSEASVIVPNGETKQFIVMWQNAFETDLRSMSFLVERTVRHYLEG